MRFGQRKCIGFKRRRKRDLRDRGDIAYAIVIEFFLHRIGRNILFMSDLYGMDRDRSIHPI